MTDLELAQAFYTNYCEMWRTVGAVAPAGSAFSVRQCSDMLLIRSNLPRRIPHMILDPVVDGRATREWVGYVVEQLTASPVSLMVAIPPGEEQSPLVRALEGEGFMPGARPLVAMARAGAALEVRTEPGSEITVATTGADLAEAQELLAVVFGLPLEVFAFYTPPALVRTYLLRRQGTATAAMCLCPFAGYAGIYSVAVLPAARGRGYARLLIQAALRDAMSQGMGTAVLSCERNLVGLYRSLGFTACWDLAAYWIETWWR